MFKGPWQKFLCGVRLQLKGTLNGGQSFRWKKEADSDKEQWIGIFSGCLWCLMRENDHILYKVYDPAIQNDDEPPIKRSKAHDQNKYELLLHNYFRLDINLDDYYKKWSKADPYFEIAAKDFYGIRLLAQDPVENIFSFICSSNNNISRISSMIEKMCVLYGTKICTVKDVSYYNFPTVENLAQPGVEKALREAGFGYRAGYISKSALKIVELGGTEWIESLKTMEYVDAKKSLMILTGIGAKVADCICLMSLGHFGAIPVDTHVYQIASKYYLKHLRKTKTVTDKVYNEIGDYFRELYGSYAGWAHTVLFCADLKLFKNDNEPVSKTKLKSKTK